MDYLSEKLDELSLKTAYEQTEYSIEDTEIIIKCGEVNPSLDEYLKRLGKRNWTFITASNPKSVFQSDRINAWSNSNLEIDLSKTGYAYTYGVGKAKSGDWPVEHSFIVFDMPLDEARNLSQKYSQNAILIGRYSGIARLEWI